MSMPAPGSSPGSSNLPPPGALPTYQPGTSNAPPIPSSTSTVPPETHGIQGLTPAARTTLPPETHQIQGLTPAISSSGTPSPTTYSVNLGSFLTAPALVNPLGGNLTNFQLNQFLVTGTPFAVSVPSQYIQRTTVASPGFSQGLIQTSFLPATFSTEAQAESFVSSILASAQPAGIQWTTPGQSPSPVALAINPSTGQPGYYQPSGYAPPGQISPAQAYIEANAAYSQATGGRQLVLPSSIVSGQGPQPTGPYGKTQTGQILNYAAQGITNIETVSAANKALGVSSAPGTLTVGTPSPGANGLYNVAGYSFQTPAEAQQFAIDISQGNLPGGVYQVSATKGGPQVSFLSQGQAQQYLVQQGIASIQPVFQQPGQVTANVGGQYYQFASAAVAQAAIPSLVAGTAGESGGLVFVSPQAAQTYAQAQVSNILSATQGRPIAASSLAAQLAQFGVDVTGLQGLGSTQVVTTQGGYSVYQAPTTRVGAAQDTGFPTVPNLSAESAGLTAENRGASTKVGAAQDTAFPSAPNRSAFIGIESEINSLGTLDVNKINAIPGVTSVTQGSQMGTGATVTTVETAFGTLTYTGAPLASTTAAPAPKGLLGTVESDVSKVFNVTAGTLGTIGFYGVIEPVSYLTTGKGQAYNPQAAEAGGKYGLVVGGALIGGPALVSVAPEAIAGGLASVGVTSTNVGLAAGAAVGGSVLASTLTGHPLTPTVLAENVGFTLAALPLFGAAGIGGAAVGGRAGAAVAQVGLGAGLGAGGSYVQGGNVLEGAAIGAASVAAFIGLGQAAGRASNYFFNQDLSSPKFQQQVAETYGYPGNEAGAKQFFEDIVSHPQMEPLEFSPPPPAYKVPGYQGGGGAAAQGAETFTPTMTYGRIETEVSPEYFQTQGQAETSPAYQALQKLNTEEPAQAAAQVAVTQPAPTTQVPAQISTEEAYAQALREQQVEQPSVTTSAFAASLIPLSVQGKKAKVSQSQQYLATPSGVESPAVAFLQQRAPSVLTMQSVTPLQAEEVTTLDYTTPLQVATPTTTSQVSLESEQQRTLNFTSPLQSFGQASVQAELQNQFPVGAQAEAQTPLQSTTPIQVPITVPVSIPTTEETTPITSTQTATAQRELIVPFQTEAFVSPTQTETFVDLSNWGQRLKAKKVKTKTKSLFFTQPVASFVPEFSFGLKGAGGFEKAVSGAYSFGSKPRRRSRRRSRR
jgi:hypothetical protein